MQVVEPCDIVTDAPLDLGIELRDREQLARRLGDVSIGVEILRTAGPIEVDGIVEVPDDELPGPTVQGG
jgi:hypothetical protein